MGTESLEPFLATVWADDLAFAFSHASADQMTDKFAIAAVIIIDELGSRGLQLNFGPGKTAALINLRGHGSVARRRALFHHQHATIKLATCTHGVVDLRVVPHYKHLGGILHSSGKMGPKLRTRVAVARAAFEKHRKSIYQQPRLSITQRFNIFRSCVLTVAYFGAGAWTDITQKEWSSFAHGILTLMRRLIVIDIGADTLRTWTDLRVLAYIGSPSPYDLLRLARSSYYRSLLAAAPDVLWALIANEQTWHTAALRDLTWVQELLDAKVPRPSPTADPDYWISLAVEHPGTWKRLIKKARAKTVLTTSIRAEVSLWHGAFHALLADAGVPLPTAPVAADDSPEVVHGCLPCRRLFTTKAAWSVHCFRVHGRTAPSRQYADGQSCDVCGKFFHNHVRLSNHLRNNPSCLDELRRRGVRCTPLPGVNSRAWRSANPWTQCPYIHTEGPRMHSQREADDFDAYDLHLLETLIVIEDKLDLPEWGLISQDWLQDICAACCSSPVGIDRIRTLLRYWHTDFALRWLHQRLRPLNATCLGQAILEAADRASVEYFLPETVAQWKEGRPSPNKLTAEESFAQASSERLCHYVPSPRLVPHFKQLVFVHLYSGYRRLEDLQDWIETIDWSPNLRPVVVSVDIVVDRATCNILDPDQRLKWFRFSQRGLIHGLMVGPPCETWSVARERYVTTGQGPRPLRRRDLPWLTDGLTFKELRQLYVSNVLLFFAIMMLISQWLVHAWGCLEHPACPAKKHAPSIWTTAVLKVLTQLGGLQSQTVYQGFFKSKSPKPTTLLTSWDESFIQKNEFIYRVCRHLPPPLKMGKESDSSFYATAALKTYPSAFCRLLAMAFHSHVHVGPLGDVDVPPDVLALFQQLVTQVTDEQHLGPDFAFN
eukprot:Skav200019  [mRNA]  locus=scaffold2535:94180:96834:- [translate_table: standard]